jgi:hypothetical protein
MIFMRSLNPTWKHRSTGDYVDSVDNYPCQVLPGWDNGYMGELSQGTSKTYTILYCADCQVELPTHWKERPKSLGNLVIELTLDNETNEILKRKVIQKEFNKRRTIIYRHGGKNKKKMFCHRAPYHEINYPDNLIGNNGLEFVFDWYTSDKLICNR